MKAATPKDIWFRYCRFRGTWPVHWKGWFLSLAWPVVGFSWYFVVTRLGLDSFVSQFAPVDMPSSSRDLFALMAAFLAPVMIFGFWLGGIMLRHTAG